jgi:hypothetical protein
MPYLDCCSISFYSERDLSVLKNHSEPVTVTIEHIE